MKCKERRQRGRPRTTREYNTREGVRKREKTLEQIKNLARDIRDYKRLLNTVRQNGKEEGNNFFNNKNHVMVMFKTVAGEM